MLRGVSCCHQSPEDLYQLRHYLEEGHIQLCLGSLHLFSTISRDWRPPSTSACPHDPAPSLAHLAKVPEGCRVSFTELRDQRDCAQLDAWGQGGAVNGGPGHGTLYYTCVCMCASPLADELGFLICFSFHLFIARPEVDSGHPWALTMMALTKQFGTRWEEDAGELRVLPDHVHCSQNSLQKSRASERATKLESTPLPHGRPTGNKFWKGTRPHLTFFRT